MRIQRVLILEGPDGTGKTSIANRMSTDFGIPYFKFNGEHHYWRNNSFKTALEFDQPMMLQYLQQTKSDLIWDRAWPSEWVYSHVFERETNLELLKQLDAEYAKMGIWIIITMRKSYSAVKPDEVIPHNKLVQIHDAYDLFCDWSTCSTLRIYVDTFDNDVSKQIEAIKAIVKFPIQWKQSIVLEGR